MTLKAVFIAITDPVIEFAAMAWVIFALVCIEISERILHVREED